MDNITDFLRKRKRMEEDSFWFGYDPSEAEEEARRQGCQPFYEDVVGVPVTDPFQDYKPPDLLSLSCESLATKGFAAETLGKSRPSAVSPDRSYATTGVPNSSSNCWRSPLPRILSCRSTRTA